MMAPRPFTTHTDYVQSIHGLHRLHELTVAGEDETPDAEVIRDNLEPLWWNLSEAERKRISGLSEDLHSISDPPHQVLASNPQFQRYLVQAMEARRRGDWDRALDLLRRWARYIEPASLSYLRGSIWLEAGDPSTAVFFLAHASNLDRTNENYSAIHLHSLNKSDPASALRLSHDILADENAHPPNLIVIAANIVFGSFETTPDPIARPILQNLTSILERTLDRLKSSDERKPLEINQASFVHIMYNLLSSCYGQLGNIEKAIQWIDCGLAVDPNDAELLAFRGMLRYGVAPGSIKDLESAVRLCPQFVWPFFFLAHHYLVSNRYEECRKMSEQALGMTAPDSAKADLYEWLAISKSALGVPREQIQMAFEDAVLLAPDNERIRRNFDLFLREMTQQSSVRDGWTKPQESVIQAIGRSQYRLMSFEFPPNLAA